MSAEQDRPNAAACGPGGNIVETAVAAGDFKTLTSLVEQAGLAETLTGKGPYTVFAPTDAAFAKVPKATLAELAKDSAALRSVLLYHVAKGELTAAKVVKRRSIKTLDGRARPRPRARRAGHRRRRARHDTRRPRVQRRDPRSSTRC